MITVKCKGCGVDVTRPPSLMKSKNTFCSSACNHEWLRVNSIAYKPRTGIEVACVVCQKVHYRQLKRPKTDRPFCSRKCAVIYRKETGIGCKKRSGKPIACVHCGKEIYRKPSQLAEIVNPACSRECRRLFILSQRVVTVCDQCHTEIKLPRSTLKWNSIRGHKHVFCSTPCARKYNCGENAGNWKGGRIVTDREYVLVQDKDTDSPVAGSYRYEHRRVMEAAIGRRLKRSEHVHHKDGNKLNNNIDNLILLTANEHAQLHNRLRNRDESGRFTR